MSALTVRFEPVRWNICPAAELLLPGFEDRAREWVRAETARRLRKLFEVLLAGTKSDYLESKIKNEVLGATAFTAPATVYTGLWTSALADASHGGTAGEVSGGAYDRVSKTNNGTNFASVADNVAKVNSNAHTFPQATANWGTVTHMGIFDGNAKTSADNLLIWADLTTSKAVNNGDTAEFATSAISWTED